jgi:uncharacterized protein YlxP (DUF503 family)
MISINLPIYLNLKIEWYNPLKVKRQIVIRLFKILKNKNCQMSVASWQKIIFKNKYKARMMDINLPITEILKKPTNTINK